MITDIVLSQSDLDILQSRFEVSSNEDFKKYFTAYVNERRKRMKADLTITNPSSALIRRLNVEFSPTISKVKHFARMKGWKKNSDFLSSMNSKKAKHRFNIGIQKKAEIVDNITAWFRSLSIGQTSFGQFESASKCKSVSSMLARWNHTEGRDKGIFLSARYFWDVAVIAIRAQEAK